MTVEEIYMKRWGMSRMMTGKRAAGKRTAGKRTTGKRTAGKIKSAGKDHRYGSLSGSYTVEASILVSLILLILMTWFYLTFSFHDRLIFRALALYYTEAAGRMMEEPVSEEGRLEIERLNERSGIIIGSYASRIKPSVLEERFAAAADSLMFISAPAAVKMNAGGREVRFSFASETNYPAVLPGMRFIYEDNGARGEIRYSLSVPPETFIRAARGLIWRE